MSRLRKSALERVLRMCTTKGRCLVWNGHGKDGDRAPQVRGDDHVLIHPNRVLWREKNGQVPPGMHLRRVCATRLCLAPAHHVVDSHPYPKSAILRGTHSPAAKLTEMSVAAARRRYNEGETVEQLAQQSGVTYVAMYRALLGRTWGHVEDPPAVKMRDYCGSSRRRKPELWPK